MLCGDAAIQELRTLDNYGRPVRLNKNFEQCDHQAWRVPVHRWKNVTLFIEADAWEDGLHVIEVEGGPHIDLLFSGLSEVGVGPNALPVFFNGAVSSRETKTGPFFSGVGIAALGGLPYVAISDPSLMLSDSVGLAWYVGNKHAPYQLLIELLLRALQKRYDRELLMVGGCGGGYASMYYAHRLGSTASALVWNPQTDVLEYNENFVKDFAKQGLLASDDMDLSSSPWKQMVSDTAKQLGIQLSLNSGMTSTAPRRLLYLQNADDWHVVSHLVPYLNAFGYSNVGRGRYSTGGNHAVWISQFGVGHSPPSPEVILRCIEELRDPEMSAEAVVELLYRDKVFGDQDYSSVPRDLTFLRSRLEEVLVFNAEGRPDGYHLSVDLGPVPLGYGGLLVDFAELHGTSARVLCQFQKRMDLVVAAEVPSADRRQFRARLRDGFGNIVLTLHAEIQADAARVVIYGSASTMEAFDLPNEFDVLEYVARSSLSTSFLPSVKSACDDLISGDRPSKFYRNILEFNFDKKLPELLSSAEFNVLLIDLLDERFPISPVEDSYVTKSPELRRLGFEGPSEGEVLPGSPKHLEMCKTGIERLIGLVSPQKVIVNRLFWATHDSGGNLLPQKEEIARQNEFLSQLYSLFAQYDGIRFIDYPEGTLLSEQVHKWGPTPYRFGSTVHHHLLDSLRTMASVPVHPV